MVELTRHWARGGLNVMVAGSIPEPMRLHGVRYVPVEQLPGTVMADVVVLWRLYGVMPYLEGRQRFQSRLLVVDLHDRQLFGHEHSLHDAMGSIDTLLFKSRFHADHLIGMLPGDKQAPLRERGKVIANGIRKRAFQLANPPAREAHRFCYASCYSRGLDPLIRCFWPSVRQLWPDAELHVYYGMDLIRDSATRERIGSLLHSEGVHDHGRQPVSVISEEKHRSSFHLYYTASVIETDCISIKESAVAGCIPIISSMNVFAERAGVVMPGEASSDQDFVEAGQAFVHWVQQTPAAELEQIRAALREVKSHLDWEQTAALWGRELELVPATARWAELQQLPDPAKPDAAASGAAHPTAKPDAARTADPHRAMVPGPTTAVPDPPASGRWML